MSNVLITGCSSGFGLLTARKFGSRGDRVFATVRDPARAAKLADARDKEGLPITILHLDVRDDASIRAAVSAALDDGPIDVLVNNAGYALRSSVEEVSDDDVRELFDTNVFGVVRMVRAVAPSMREQRRGIIVNVSSIVAVVSQPFGGFYSASKAAVEAIGEALYHELTPWGIRVAIVEPGSYPTRFQENTVRGSTYTSASPYIAQREGYERALASLAARLGHPEPQEVADAIFDVVQNPQAPFRTVVGEAAQGIVRLRQSTDFEGYVQAFRKMLGLS